MENVFHQGELEIQKRAGETRFAEGNKRMIMPFIANGAINFIEKQPMAVVGSRNKDNELWTSILIGNFGFVKVLDPTTIIFDAEKLISDPNDVFFSNIAQDGQIGTLFIELDTRKRLRINGSCSVADSKIELTVEQSYPNCPKYIQRRVISVPEYFNKARSKSSEGTGLSEDAINWIQRADTFFVASASMDGRLDASHRGGNPGFVETTKEGTLKIPDYPGASLFNTLGNVLQNPNVGMLFIDFEKRETLQLTGSASLLFEQVSEDDLEKSKGTGRFWFFHPKRWIRTIEHHSVGWDFLEYSPFNP